MTLDSIVPRGSTPWGLCKAPWAAGGLQAIRTEFARARRAPGHCRPRRPRPADAGLISAYQGLLWSEGNLASHSNRSRWDARDRHTGHIRISWPISQSQFKCPLLKIATARKSDSIITYVSSNTGSPGSVNTCSAFWMSSWLPFPMQHVQPVVRWTP